MGYNIFTLLACVCGYIIYIQAANAEHKHGSRFYNGDYDCGYAEVRKGAFLFWWLYYAGGDKNSAFEKPFIIWIQGSPGSSASALTNFKEIGPQDMYHNTRNLSWVHKRNVLFIDSPVGSGFSYYTNPSLIVKTEDQLVKDLVELMKQFLQKIPDFETVPTHIYSQSYGGKIVPRLAYYLFEEKKAGKLKLNLKSVGLGSSFVSPKDFTLAYPKYLFNTGYIDTVKYKKINNYSQDSAKACDDGLYNKAHELRKDMILYTPNGFKINMFNMLKPRQNDEDFQLSNFMNTAVKSALNAVIPDSITYRYLNIDVVQALSDQMMIPSVDYVERLLNESDISVAVYSGNLDVVLPLTGALKWVNNLNWPGAQKFRKAKRNQIHGHRNGHYKFYNQLSFWWIYNAGHSVADNLEAMEYLLMTVVESTPKISQADFYKYDVNLSQNSNSDDNNKLDKNIDFKPLDPRTSSGYLFHG